MAELKPEKRLIELLGEANYRFWAFQMKQYLQLKDLWHVISEEVPPRAGIPPAAGSTEQVMNAYRERLRIQQEWDSASGKTMNAIAMNVDRGNSNLLYETECGRQAWKFLKDFLIPTTMGNKMRANCRLMELKLTDDKTIMQHLTEMQEIFNELAEYNEPLSELNKVTHLFRTVGSDYHALATAVLNWPEERITVYAAKQQLVEEWYRVKDRKNAMKTNNDALIAKQNLEIEKQAAAMAAKWLRQDKAEIICYGCGKKGHYKRECSQLRFTGDLRWKINKKKENKEAGVGEEYSSCLFIESMKKDEWVLDSGATRHMTSDEKVFKMLKRHNGSVTVANGAKLPVIGTGTVLLKPGPAGEKLSDRRIELKSVLLVPGLGVNLISVKELTNNGVAVRFDSVGVSIYNGKTEQKIGVLEKGHYCV